MELKAFLIVKIFLFLVCLGILLYMSIAFILATARNPVGTVVDNVPLNSTTFPSAVVCIGGWFYLMKDRPLNETFAMGFMTGNRYFFLNALKPTDEEYSQQMKESMKYLKDKDTFSAHISKLLQVKSSGVDVTVEPVFLNKDHQCVVIKGRNQTRIDVDSTAALTRFTEFVFTLPAKFNNVIRIALYHPKSFDHLLKRHFFIFKPRDYGNRIQGVYKVSLKAAVTKYEYAKDMGCMEEDEDELRLPLNYEEDACNTECVFEAVEATYGCSPVPRYLNGNRSIPPCHALIESDRRTDKANQFHDAKEACMAKSKCSEKQSCVEWNAALSMQNKEIFMSGPQMKFEFKVSFDPRMTVVRQFKLHTFEAIMANLGGLAGMWLGVSIFTMSEAVFRFATANSRKKKVDNDNPTE